MKKSIILAAMALVTLASACQDDKYVANVTELSLVRMDPESGYSGAIVKVLGRNFSEKAKDNVVLIGGKDANVLDASCIFFDVHKNILRYKSYIIACHIIICYYSG